MDICKYHIVGAIVLISTCLQNVLLGDNVYQFQYQCYLSLCTYPLEYCSSVDWERRCIPCLLSVCQSEEVPLACRFNCSFKGETLKNSSEIVIGHHNGWDNFSGPVWFISTIVISFAAALLATVLIIVIRDRKIKLCENETESPLVPKHTKVIPTDKCSSPSTESQPSHYCEQKLKGTPVTSFSCDNEDEYKPTTHLQR